MSKEKRLIPKRRFKQFINTGAWEQRKLGSIANFSSGFTVTNWIEPNGREAKLYNVSRIETISNGFIDPRKFGFTITPPPKKYLLSKGDILYSNVNSIGHIGKTAIIDKSYNLYHGINLLRLQIDDDYDDKFVYFSLNTDKSISWAKSIAKAAVNQVSISQSDLKDQILSVCTLEEQRKIADLLDKLYNLITLHQRKLKKLKSLKKAYLSAMFPAEGQRKPKLRFKGFTDAWEQRELKDIATITMGQSPNSSFYSNKPFGKILIQGNADIKDNLIFPRVWTSSYHKIAHKNDILITVRAPVGEIAKTYDDVAIGRGMAAISGDQFLFFYLLYYQSINFWDSLSSGSTFDAISSKDLEDAIILLPHLQERKKIELFLTKILELITLHQRKLEKLQNIKKAYLNEMFV